MATGFPSLQIYEIHVRQIDVQQPPPAVVDSLLALVDGAEARSKVFPIYVDKVTWSNAAGVTMGSGPYIAVVKPDGAISNVRLSTGVTTSEDFAAFLKSG